MTNSHPIEKDVFYNRLSFLTASVGLNSVEKVLFLSVFEGWYHTLPYGSYSLIAAKAIEALEAENDA